MKHPARPCETFRALLEEKLAGTCPASAGEARLGELSWHEHLLFCQACRALLAAEQVLDILLATLPEPNLPRELAERVLARLRAGRAEEDELDALLDLDRTSRLPDRLASRVLARLANERAHTGAAASGQAGAAAIELAGSSAMQPASAAAVESIGSPAMDPASAAAVDSIGSPAMNPVSAAAMESAGAAAKNAASSPAMNPASAAAMESAGSSAMEKTRLEALLDCDRTIDIPSGLARRVLVALRDERALEPLPAPLRATRPTVARLRSRWIYALAAGVLVALGVAWWVNRTGARPEDSAPLAEENQEDRAAPEGKLTPQLGEHATEVARLASSAAPDAELLAALGVLEQWDLLMQGDVDVLLSTLDPAEPILLDDEAELPPAPVHEKEAEQPSKG